MEEKDNVLPITTETERKKKKKKEKKDETLRKRINDSVLRSLNIKRGDGPKGPA